MKIVSGVPSFLQSNEDNGSYLFCSKYYALKQSDVSCPKPQLVYQFPRK